MLAEGTTIGTYRVQRKIGEGGMGAVYIGEHTLLGRKVAIKVLLTELSSHQEIVQRFFNEAKAVTQIADPGIVQVFDFGYHTDGSAFIIMELLDGEPMDKRLERIGRFSPTDCLRLMRLICQSLGAAHAKGIVHRDLKPENIYIVGDPAVTGGERAKILDFGIAKLTADEPKKMKTRTGMVMGTPVYMSPEQCRGAGEVDARSDIYSIGCVMMTMLTGRPPFEGEGSGDLIAAHMITPPPLAGARLPGLPELFDQILQRCLAKSAKDRFQSMPELAKTLGHAEQMMLHSVQPTMAGDVPGYVGSGLTPPPNLRMPTGGMPPPGTAPGIPTPTTLTGASGQAGTQPGSPAPKNRGAVIGASIGAVLLIGIVVFAVTRGGDATTETKPATDPGSAVVTQPTVPMDAAAKAVATNPGSGATAGSAMVATVPVDAGIPDAPAVVEVNPVDAAVEVVVKRPKSGGGHRPPKVPSPAGGSAQPAGSASARPVDRGD
ncbi:MAG: serine/threonine protein kinase [Myxococcales bacterium]|nr:serine/threonine protein kinase [Myxococcales bacterium]